MNPKSDWIGMPAPTPEKHYGLQIAVIREDRLPQGWAAQVSRRAIRLVGPRSVRTACWSFQTLDDSMAMEAATEAAIAADILVIAVSGVGPLPTNIDRWIDSWLPRRLDRPGALVAIIGVPQQPSAFPVRVREYLRDVASLAHMDFLLQERSLPLGHPHSLGEVTADPQRISQLDGWHVITSRAA
jgi:hypothetical protein